MSGSGETSEGMPKKRFGRVIWTVVQIVSKEGDIGESRPETQHVTRRGNRKMVLSLKSHFGNDCN